MPVKALLDFRHGQRELRDACLSLVRRHGTEHTLGGRSVTEFERAPFTIWLTPSGDGQCLDVWHDAELAAVLSLCWSGDALTLGSFRRDEGERSSSSSRVSMSDMRVPSNGARRC